MRKVYVITQGNYSNYRILGVCSSKKKAELALATANGGKIEIYDLDEVDRLKPGWANYSVWMQRNGDSHVERNFAQYPPLRTTEHQTTAKRVLYVTGYFESKQHAVKVANEIRTRLLAEEVEA